MAVQQGPKERGPGADKPGLSMSLVARERGVLQIRGHRTEGRRRRTGQSVESAGGEGPDDAVLFASAAEGS